MPLVSRMGVNNDLVLIAEKLKLDKLSFNIKTRFMCLSAKNKTTPCIFIQIDGKAIAQVNEKTLLGVMIDNKLS